MYSPSHDIVPPCCGNCRFYRPLDPEQVEPDEDELWGGEEEAAMSEAGKCVRYPPRFFYPELLNGEWPVVNSEDYCGEHARNPHV